MPAPPVVEPPACSLSRAARIVSCFVPRVLGSTRPSLLA